MNLTKINENSELLNADKKQKKAIFTLIDLKTNQDMKEVILEIRALRTEMESRLSTLEKLVWGILLSITITVVATVILKIIG